MIGYLPGVGDLSNEFAAIIWVLPESLHPNLLEAGEHNIQ